MYPCVFVLTSGSSQYVGALTRSLTQNYAHHRSTYLPLTHNQDKKKLAHQSSRVFRVRVLRKQKLRRHCQGMKVWKQIMDLNLRQQKRKTRLDNILEDEVWLYFLVLVTSVFILSSRNVVEYCTASFSVLMSLIKASLFHTFVPNCK